ncbi:hypothetical protein [Mycobacteroides immunogenum]|uniref:Uncharacterized protein n=1 Tax=Mycobacteroides immunogenum TaxID=83262 RepID=A0A7V8RXC0_9MYCO|nr:hypothetical protein [Mycobacteroides immunogenum]KPG13734.1 hypothetical protein AN909_05635 [Mycobacteroides immunogenum]KPG14277.1 hypothetical protein AN908_06770 [Mycobacteroides immunogenum]KPG14353.1 hypothetical protein AN908_07280 [Mycobacteroides immunogenum]KPG17448.1 hypothetical protein AN910_04860 [Mycobacteroides immunogenum]KPG23968.1 hypothetical protein AN911_00300 [Mycobacteroides immunogenum]
MSEQYYCTYCDYYSRKVDGTRDPEMAVFIGTKAQVVAHANSHPIGSPTDMAELLSLRAPYES